MSDPFEEWKSARGNEPIPSSIPAGTVIGEYEVLGLIGRGGSAEVYSATHVKLGATVAIKILHKLTEQSRIRFDREAKILSGTTHPCFPQFKSYWEFEGRPYIVTELLGPCVLPRTDKDAAKFLLKVLDGVGCLHRLGFVHRDIKPANILMRNGKEPVLTDFGLACPISASRQIMGRISIVDGRPAGVGTPGYAAPEQFEGGEVSAATDVHAVGMLADECFDGKPPRCWRRIIDRATNSRLAHRYQTADEMAFCIRCLMGMRMAGLAVLTMLVLAVAAVIGFGVVRWVFDRHEDEIQTAFGIRFGDDFGTMPRSKDAVRTIRLLGGPSGFRTMKTGCVYAFNLVADNKAVAKMPWAEIATECTNTLEEVREMFGLKGRIEVVGAPSSSLFRCRLKGRGCTFTMIAHRTSSDECRRPPNLVQFAAPDPKRLGLSRKIRERVDVALLCENDRLRELAEAEARCETSK